MNNYLLFTSICLYIFVLEACIEVEEIAIPVQISPFICKDGWKYDLQNEIIVDEFGAAIPCEVLVTNANKQIKF